MLQGMLRSQTSVLTSYSRFSQTLHKSLQAARQPLPTAGQPGAADGAQQPVTHQFMNLGVLSSSASRLYRFMCCQRT